MCWRSTISYADHLEHLRAELLRLGARVRAGGDVPLWPDQPPGAPGALLEQLFEDPQANRIAARIATSPPDLPLLRLSALYDLDRLDMDLLLTVLLAEVEPRAFAEPLTRELLCRLHAPTFAGRIDVLARIGRGGSLEAKGLVEEGGAPRLAPRIRGLILGWSDPDPALVGIARLLDGLPPDALVAPAEIEKMLRHVDVSRPSMWLVSGHTGTGRKTLARVLAHRAERRLLVVDGALLDDLRVPKVLQECWLEGYLLCFESGIAAGNRLGPAELARWCALLEGPLILVDTSRRGWPALPSAAPIHSVHLEEPTEALRRRMWIRLLTPLGDTLEQVDPAALAHGHAMSGGQIEAAVEQAVVASGPITMDVLEQTCAWVKER